ncbi:hypothetical protein [Mycobacterium sp. RTGN5]|uniref:hypothetical protein n=1 Tax=Mycobacterium sp. RTGN5 TaxID=3016522 RepID=UPI0029C80168|nr:hypothetical protein [Mycobacterium sp. RTGN5]
MMLALALALAVPITAGVCFVAYLVLMAFVVIRTGSTEGLKDVATAMRAYKVPLLGRTGKRSTTDDGGAS